VLSIRHTRKTLPGGSCGSVGLAITTTRPSVDRDELDYERGLARRESGSESNLKAIWG
jgi:hypothetical protein